MFWAVRPVKATSIAERQRIADVHRQISKPNYLAARTLGGSFYSLLLAEDDLAARRWE